MTSALPASSRSFRGSRPRAAAHQRPSGRSHSTRTDSSTITSPTRTRSRTQISPGIHGADENINEHNHSPPEPLTDAPVQISGSGRTPRARVGAAAPSRRRSEGVSRSAGQGPPGLTRRLRACRPWPSSRDRPLDEHLDDWHVQCPFGVTPRHGARRPALGSALTRPYSAPRACKLVPLPRTPRPRVRLRRSSRLLLGW